MIRVVIAFLLMSTSALAQQYTATILAHPDGATVEMVAEWVDGELYLSFSESPGAWLESYDFYFVKDDHYYMYSFWEFMVIGETGESELTGAIDLSAPQKLHPVEVENIERQAEDGPIRESAFTFDGNISILYEYPSEDGVKSTTLNTFNKSSDNDDDFGCFIRSLR